MEHTPVNKHSRRLSESSWCVQRQNASDTINGFIQTRNVFTSNVTCCVYYDTSDQTVQISTTGSRSSARRKENGKRKTRRLSTDYNQSKTQGRKLKCHKKPNFSSDLLQQNNVKGDFSRAVIAPTSLFVLLFTQTGPISHRTNLAAYFPGLRSKSSE